MVDGWIKENIESFFIFINKTSPWREGKRSGKRDEWRNEESYKEMAQSTRRHSLRLFLNNNEMQSSW